MKPTKRVLVVDDYEPWRRFVCSTLQQRPELQVIGEVSDGSEAVRSAEELQPDLILLDIGLPTLNGIEAARRIRSLSPKSRILFLSENRSRDIADEALRAGGSGYVAKSDAKRELLLAVEAVLEGRRFVSTSLGQNLTDSTKEHSDDTDRREGLVAPSPLPNPETARRHEVGFYFDDELLVDHGAQFIGAALRSGNVAILLATAWHRDSIVAKLQAQGFDIGAAIERGRYIALDAAEALSMIMSDGKPDPVRFLQLIGVFIATAAETMKAAGGEHARVAIFGECVHLLWAQGNAEAAIQFEKLGNQLLSRYDIDILCAYSLGGVQGGMDDNVFQRICAEHSAVHRREPGC